LPKCQLLNTLKYACSHTWKKKKNVTWFTKNEKNYLILHSNLGT
jgi:hypothetical protein